MPLTDRDHRSTDRHQGGPGSSHENAKKPHAAEEKHPNPGEATNSSASRVSGGGGERDVHHTHDPRTKS